MAMMRPLKAVGLLSLSPVLQSSTCWVSPLFTQRDLQNQCMPFSTSTLPESLGYRIAASFSAKGRRFNPKNDLFSFDPEKQPSLKQGTPRQRPNSGQDSFFVASIGNSTNLAFGVADGVGGWIDSGIDSAHFSHGLCESMAAEAQSMDLSKKKRLYAGELLQKGYEKVIAEETVTGGGTTACIAIAGSDGNLEVAK